MIDVEAQANRDTRGVVYTRNLAPAVDGVEEKAWQHFIVDAVDANQRRVLSVIDHESGTLVVNNMKVESIKRVLKKGKKLYRIILKQVEEGGDLNSRVNAGSYKKCSCWVNSWDDLPGVKG